MKVGDPQFTLIWDTDDVDLDLHVLEPGGKEIFWEDPKGDKGGELDVDNTKGFGPENVYWLVESDGPDSEKVKGPGPPGVYKWYRRLLGRLRRHRQADALAGPGQARRQGHRLSRQVQGTERAKQDLHAHRHRARGGRPVRRRTPIPAAGPRRILRRKRPRRPSLRSGDASR